MAQPAGRASERRSGPGDARVALHQQDPGENHDERDEVPDQGVGPDGDVIADLVQSEQLVLHDPVVELESADPEQQAARPPFRDEAAPAVRIGQQEKTGDHRDEPARMKQAVRHQPDSQRGLVIEMMPVQKLVEDRLVDERHQACPGQHPRPDASPGLLGRRVTNAARKVRRGHRVAPPACS